MIGAETLTPGSRVIVQADALSWIGENATWPGTSVVTSLPDVSEMSALGLDGWKAWFVDTVERVLLWIPPDGVAIFYQSDVRHQGTWIDKGYLVMQAAERAGASLVWHKIVCRRPAGTIAQGRPSYSRMLCVSPVARAAPVRPGPDVLAEAGHMSWSRAMGETACRVACRFLKEDTLTRVVVDPFCGQGSVLAVANQLGFAAVGVDVSPRRCRIAREHGIPDQIGA